MEALRASYGEASSDSDSDTSLPITTVIKTVSTPKTEAASVALPPPPLSLLTPPNSLDYLGSAQPGRVRSFPHVEGNYALHVYIPVYIPATAKKGVAMLLKKVSSSVPGLHVVDADIPLNVLARDNDKLEQIALGKEFHISLGRTIPIRVHQIDSIVAMLRQKLQFQKRSVNTL
uniref:U6 snRNA phosphodiesterase 1 n=1 Tax=Rhizophora mucronata TaxID=61149 RepID=A0A2P2K065_RHIMU